MRRDDHAIEDATIIPPELAAVAAAADASIAGAAELPGADQAEQSIEPDHGANLGGMLTMLVIAAKPALPFLAQCYTPEVCQQIGIAFAAVAKKHGWNLDATDSPELALAFVAIPPSIAAVKLGREHFAAQRAKDVSPPKQQPDQA